MSLDHTAAGTSGPASIGRATIGLSRLYTSAGVDPSDEVVWERRDARITNWLDGSVAFEQLGVEFPISWSQNATNIVTQKYFRGPLGAPEREWSLKQVVDRIVDTITDWGLADGYFDGDEAEPSVQVAQRREDALAGGHAPRRARAAHEVQLREPQVAVEVEAEEVGVPARVAGIALEPGVLRGHRLRAALVVLGALGVAAGQQHRGAMAGE